MTPLEIKIELMQARISQSEIARRLGVSPAAVTRMVAGDSTSDPIQREICNVIGRDPVEVFPDRYCHPPGPWAENEPLCMG
ncbi:MAG: helix-turn-helix domain-containing protein [Desulfobacterales bacterium]|nr:helix-turn-helix domain-containing protein [Desulfobacterales bacterium]